MQCVKFAGWPGFDPIYTVESEGVADEAVLMNKVHKKMQKNL
jgi:hypothetical protein